MKAMFISKELNLTSGSGVGARMHRDILIKLMGESRVFIVDVSVHALPERRKNYISYGKYKNPVERIIRHLQGNIYLFSDNIIKSICRIIKKENIGFVFIDDSCFGKLVKNIKAEFPKLPVVAFFHDVKAELFPIWIKRSKLIDKLDFRLGMRNEALTIKYSDKNIVLNKKEDELLFKHYKVHSDFYLPVCVNREMKAKALQTPYKTTGKKHILFVGTSYYPNVQGIKWFYHKVFKSLSKHYDLWIVGNGLESMKNYFNDSEVYVIGFAEDLGSFYRGADIVVAPLTAGGGMKIKTAEAFSYGKVFIGSTESLEGYYEVIDKAEEAKTIKENLIFRCDTAKEYRQILAKLNNIPIKKENKEIIDIFEEHFSDKAAQGYIKSIMESVLTKYH